MQHLELLVLKNLRAQISTEAFSFLTNKWVVSPCCALTTKLLFVWHNLHDTLLYCVYAVDSTSYIMSLPYFHSFSGSLLPLAVMPDPSQIQVFRFLLLLMQLQQLTSSGCTTSATYSKVLHVVYWFAYRSYLNLCSHFVTLRITAKRQKKNPGL